MVPAPASLFVHVSNGTQKFRKSDGVRQETEAPVATSMANAANIRAIPNRRLSPLQLTPYFRWSVYALFAALFLSGCAWKIMDQLKDAPDGELWQTIGANLLMVHGGVAMPTLIAIGALIPVHIARAWRARRNRIMGSIMVIFNAVLIATSFELYYSGSETLRPWMSDIHVIAGICLPGLFVVHVFSGRRSRP
jgi:hypothetical protein